jgi:uncharacterized protein
MNKNYYDVIIVGSGPSSLGCAFKLKKLKPELKILIIEQHKYSSGGLRNDGKQNYTYPIGFPTDIWPDSTYVQNMLSEASKYLCSNKLYLNNYKIYDKYNNRANKLNTQLINILQHHVGTSNAPMLIDKLVNELKSQGVEFLFDQKVNMILPKPKVIQCEVYDDKHNLYYKEFKYDKLVLAVGRKGFKFLQEFMNVYNIEYTDNIVDIGLRLELPIEHYSIVKEIYDPKFIFKDYNVRTFCTNSNDAYVIKETYDDFYSVNGHSTNNGQSNGKVNFALLKTINLTEPLTSGQEYATLIGRATKLIAGNNVIKQRVGDFRQGRRSKTETFNDDLYKNFTASLDDATAGDISLVCPSKIMRDIWKSLKVLDTIVPGALHPSNIMYFPEIKTYGNKPKFMDENFQVIDSIYMIGDGAGVSRGITAAWCSGIQAALGIVR